MSLPRPGRSRLSFVPKCWSLHDTATPPFWAAARSRTAAGSAGKTGAARPKRRKRAMPPSGYMLSRTWVYFFPVGLSSRQPKRLLGPHSCRPRTVSQPPRVPAQEATSASAPDSGRKQASTETAGAWLPEKKAVSTSTPSTVPEATPRRMTTQSKAAWLCRRVSQPSYHAPVYTILPGWRTGGVGVRRLAASANHSSEKARTLPPIAAEMRSLGGG
ncbi:hypothetical protein GGTG_06322 [Gaeumannomyces tritici R3-111a-1]|uniref:Uncharacterized protein n=1 Tax=Gaeumannomyces tritici (strain R3-111a-1) TaxID=644352 RepID=J3NYH0_GAET3|nr:hypothetical protein GGTG_06322 [Gaeumannomyces tritici R3-111a-1]EJT76403.1 hypothetical protein GGTG_06322 [Gaeumannomyces tritici R3-111a-1]